MSIGIVRADSSGSRVLSTDPVYVLPAQSHVLSPRVVFSGCSVRTVSAQPASIVAKPTSTVTVST